MSPGGPYSSGYFTRIRCADGFTMVVHASRGSKSSPQAAEGPYTAVEVAFPSDPDESLLQPYELASEIADPITGLGIRCFGWVPSEIIWDIIIKHNGHESGSLPPLIVGQIKR